MSHNHKPNPANEELAAALTAYALGELPPQEGARIAQQLQREPELQREVEQIRRLAVALRPEAFDSQHGDESWGTIPAAEVDAADASTRAAVLAALDGSPLSQSLLHSTPGSTFDGSAFDGDGSASETARPGVTAQEIAAQEIAAREIATQEIATQGGVGKPLGKPKRPGTGGGGRLTRPWLAAILSTAALLICAVFLVGPLMNSRNVAMQAPALQAPATRAPASTTDFGDARVAPKFERGTDPSGAGAELAAGAEQTSGKASLAGETAEEFDAAEGFSAETIKKSAGISAGKLVRQDRAGSRADTAVAESAAPPMPLTDSLAVNQPATTLEMLKEKSFLFDRRSLDESQPEPQSRAGNLMSSEEAKQPGDPTTARELGKRRQEVPGDGAAKLNGMRTEALGGMAGGAGGGVQASAADASGRVGGELADLPVKSAEAQEGNSLPELIEERMYYNVEPEASNRRARDSRNEQYQMIWENPFVRAAGAHALSTLAIDVDTASYANVRKFLRSGSLPPPAAVRIEEFINYFEYPYPQPDDGEPFRVDLKLFGCPWNSEHSLLRVGVQGREVPQAQRPPTNLVFLVDVSGSMSSEDKLPLLKRGLQLLVSRLSESDSVSIVTYAGEAGVALPPTKGTQQRQLLEAIERLESGGSTHGSAGIELAYQLAEQQFVQGGVNRVLWATDGDLNVGVTDDQALVELIKQKAASGVFLTVLGFGTGNLKDAKLEALADNGNGIYAYIDAIGEAHKVLVEQLSGSLVTIAKDVKIQIEFNPAQVEAYRLIGYENRVLATQDFADDRKDGGEIGAGHSVTALYEIVPAGAMLQAIEPPAVDLKYQRRPTDQQRPAADQPPAEAAAANEESKDSALQRELATVAVRYKAPDGQTSAKVEFSIDAEATSFSQADDDSRFAAAVAAFAMRLRNSLYAGSISYEAIAEIAGAARGADPQGYRAEFVELVGRARQLEASTPAAPADAGRE